MGRIRPTNIKRIAKEIVKKFDQELTTDFYKNREFLREVIDFPSQNLENRICGYVTTLKKQRERE